MQTETLLNVDSLNYYYPIAKPSFLLSWFKKNHHQDSGQGVEDISFHLKRGEILGFLGENGAGKSTTMRLISGNLLPQNGSISIKSYDLFEDPVKAKSVLGYLPDRPPLYNHMTVDEYLCYCGQLHGLYDDELHLSLIRTKEQCGLFDHGDYLIASLSMGYRQRVGIAQAIIHKPELIILDEPTNGLDPAQTEEIHQLIKLLGKKFAILISSHNLSEIQQLCQRVQLIHHGKLVYQSDIEAFNQLANTQALKISCENPVDSKKIEKLEQVSRVEAINNKELIIHCSDEVKKIAIHVVQLSAKNNWKLYELSIKTKSLAWVFKQLAYQQLSGNKV